MHSLMESLSMNLKVEALPKWKNFPIPYFVTYTKDGIPDFKIINEENRRRCANERLCWICGQKIDYWIVFIGGPIAIKHRLFTDGPMHEECARDALEICPFLVGSMDYAPDSSFRLERFDETVQLRDYTHLQVRQKPPDKIGVYKTRGFKVAVTKEKNAWFFWAEKPISVVWTKRGEYGRTNT
jgi:hypothetical protein